MVYFIFFNIAVVCKGNENLPLNISLQQMLVSHVVRPPLGAKSFSLLISLRMKGVAVLTAVSYTHLTLPTKLEV